MPDELDLDELRRRLRDTVKNGQSKNPDEQVSANNKGEIVIGDTSGREREVVVLDNTKPFAVSTQD